MWHRILEILFGLDKGFLSREGEFALNFHPRWPFQSVLGAAPWNIILILLAAAGVALIYYREGRSLGARIALAILRFALLLFVIVILNCPVITLTQSRSEPSVMAIVMDSTISMRVRDAATAPNATPITRMEAMLRLLSDHDQQLLRDLNKQHSLKLYTFAGGLLGGEKGSQALATIPLDDLNKKPLNPAPGAATQPTAAALAIQAMLDKVKPDGQQTQVLASLRDVLEDLQGQRIGGIVLLTDGRSTPAEPRGSGLAAIHNYQVKIFPVPIGSDKAPRNLAIETVRVQDSVFADDIGIIRATIRSTGYPKDLPAHVTLKNKKTGLVLKHADGTPCEETIKLPADATQEYEFLFKAEREAKDKKEPELQDIEIEIAKQDGELDDQDNLRLVQVAVLNEKISVLYCDGYPRWEYRYLVREMTRDKTVSISSFLFSADAGFIQEGNKPITRFPENMKEMLDYDAVIFGDVDPRQFTDAQLFLIQDFVAKKGGGFGIVAGPRWAPAAYKNTPIEAVLPVNIDAAVPDDTKGAITSGFRPVITREGDASGIFRFFTERELNDKYLKDDLQPLFWYSKGITLKPGVGEVYAEHPNDLGPDRRKAPILVVGRYGAGRTLYSAIDDSWRWRFYTGEQIFDSYWVQQLRYLARSKKLGQRKLTLSAERPTVDLGENVKVNLRILDPELLQQLPDQISVDIREEKNGNLVRREAFHKQEGQPDLFVANFTADTLGRFRLRPASLGTADAVDTPVEVMIPKLELNQPQVDSTLLSQLAAETMGQVVPYPAAAVELPKLVTSAAKIVPVESSNPLWDAPLAMVLFVLLITVEWILRKVFGML